MILLLDSSTPVCRLILIDENWRRDIEWQADRTLAKGLLKFIDSSLNNNDRTWSDISAIGVFEGPGSFTGLRIGMTVLNTMVDTLHIPIVGGRGKDWQDRVLEKLNSSVNEKLVLPYYGSEAKITLPKK
ncbi:MAG: tRNA (adenosine(37)-N6)-threonylcarbamoyltransferase complex dimerization subunit type 1 TsaB [Candidatus Saccharimonadaceae bacterium]|nr:tRNA (adenosine(37)-N6)-threonylcarbamoyltransferase complex dimerization subunit type 1 TsaB [Candidatus Saccharimonadaceae bacterium]